MTLALILLSTLAFADTDHTPYVTCPLDGKVYDGAAACPGTCLAVPSGTNVRTIKCQGGALVEDAAKAKTEDDKVKAIAKKAKDARDRKDRIEAQCASANGLLKEICDHILEK